MPTSRARTSTKRERWSEASAPADGSVFENVDFEELVVQNISLRGVKFINCRFKHCYFGFNTLYEDCTWDKCKFTSQHTSFGPSGIYEQCVFAGCLIQGCSVDGASFNNCSIGSALKNLTIRGKHSSRAEIMCRLSFCDLSQATFSNTCFILGVELDSVKLPTSGVRMFNNQNESLRLELLSAAKATGDKLVSTSLEALIPGDGQDPVILDPTYIREMLDTNEALGIFNKISSKYEVTFAQMA